METKTIAKINEVSILLIENGEKLVPIKPICEALGVDVESQRKKISEDEILSSTAVLSTVVATDGKEREMTCLPLMYVFGWLFTINPKNVAPEAKENVIRYKLECYKAMYFYFTAYAEFVEWKEQVSNDNHSIVKNLKKDFREAKANLLDAEKNLDTAINYTYEQYQADKGQMNMFD